MDLELTEAERTYVEGIERLLENMSLVEVDHVQARVNDTLIPPLAQLLHALLIKEDGSFYNYVEWDVGQAPSGPLRLALQRLDGKTPLELARAKVEALESDETREALAALAHEQWCGWMSYLFKQGTTNDDGSFTIAPWAVERWLRQMGTTYKELPEEEKQSDRAEADRVLHVLRGRS